MEQIKKKLATLKNQLAEAEDAREDALRGKKEADDRADAVSACHVLGSKVVIVLSTCDHNLLNSFS